MMNSFAGLLLMLTSMAPVLGGVAISQYTIGRSPWPWIMAVASLVSVCATLMSYARRNGEQRELVIAECEQNDKEVLAFLLTYLLPLASTKDILEGLNWMTALYVYALILMVFTHARAFHFNPLLGLLRYHFYAVKDSHGKTALLISKNDRMKGESITVVSWAKDVYLEV